MESLGQIDFSKLLPIFPLPNCVLLPGAIQPLHIFEPRYREMLTDTLADQGIITMAVLEPGYEAKYYTHVARIRGTVCVGTIIRHERLEDGRFNILLQGLVRARVVREDRERSYRRGVLQPLLPPEADDGRAIRQRLRRAMEMPLLSAFSQQAHWNKLLNAAHLNTSDVVDSLASVVACNVECAVRFLDETSVARRAEMLIEELSHLACRATAVPASACNPTRPWPRGQVTN